MISTQILNKADIFNAVFDYPDTAITKNYFYLTTTVYDTGEHKKYGLILRIPLDDLSYLFSNSSAKFSYDVILDRDVESITPVKGSSDPMYFGAQLPNGSSTMKVYDWKKTQQFQIL